MKNLKILSPEILRKYTKPNTIPTIAIIGNGGISPEDQAHINKADCILRFNNFATRENITKTSDRFLCDILFSTLDLHSVSSSPKDVVIGIPYPFKAQQIQPKPARWYPKAQPWMINPYDNMNLCQELGLDSLGYAHPLPSIGLTALYHMSKMQCKMFICGFNFYYDEQTGLFQKHHLSNKNYPKHWNHNYPKEIEWILKNLYGKVNINFSQSCTRLLAIAKKQLQ